MIQKIKVTEEEKSRRKELGLPLTKSLRYMKKDACEYRELDVVEYREVDRYLPSGTPSLELVLETGETVRILAPFFVHMQKTSFIEDMAKVPEDQS